MKTIKIVRKEGDKPKELTLEEMIDGIGESLEKTSGTISDDRRHSVSSHLRTVIGALGYKPRETLDADKKITTSIPELFSQLKACIENTDEVTEAQHANIHVHLRATHSNCAAEVGMKAAPALKDAPAPKKDAPGKKEGDSAPGEGLGKKVVAILVACLLGLFFATPAKALDSFSITNIVQGGVLIQSYPTNVVSTNFFITGTVTNGSVITTNGYYPFQGTGKQVETRNYEFNGFTFRGLSTSTNTTGSIIITLIRAITSGNPPQVNQNTNTGAITNTDWETTSQISLSVPVPIGTNVFINWTTNLDEWFEKPADYVGIYSITNTAGPFCMISNAFAGLGKKTIPFSLSGGNF